MKLGKGDEAIMTDFGEIKPVDIRTIWANEAADFTPWLADNIERLSEALGMEIEVLEREAAVGGFSLDLRAKDLGSGRTIVIENQLTDTDHDHLGKLLTYAGGFDAEVLVWIAGSMRDEHRNALEWLNGNTGTDIDVFGVVAEVIQIDDSKPALNLKLVVSPNEWHKRAKISTGTSPKAEAYRQFFQQLIDELRTKHKFTNAKAAMPQNFYPFSAGLTGLQLVVSLVKDGKARVEVYIDFMDKTKNKALFDAMAAQKALIEQEYGDPLCWERLDDKRASRIAVYRHGSIDDPDEKLAAIRAWAIEHLHKLRDLVMPKVKAALDNLPEVFIDDE